MTSAAEKPKKDKPEIVGEVNNVTVAVGRDAVLSCVVKNLQDYKVGGLGENTENECCQRE